MIKTGTVVHSIHKIQKQCNTFSDQRSSSFLLFLLQVTASLKHPQVIFWSHKRTSTRNKKKSKKIYVAWMHEYIKYKLELKIKHDVVIRRKNGTNAERSARSRSFADGEFFSCNVFGFFFNHNSQGWDCWNSREVFLTFNVKTYKNLIKISFWILFIF